MKFKFVNIIIFLLLLFSLQSAYSQNILNIKTKYDSFNITVDKDLIRNFSIEDLNTQINKLPEEIKVNFSSKILFDFNEHRDVFYYEDIDGYLGDFSIIFSVAYLDLNNDGINEIMVDYNTRTACGVSGFCMLYIFEKNKNEWNKIGEIHTLGLNFFVLDEVYNDFYLFSLKTPIYGKRICRFSERVNQYKCAEVD